MTKKKVLIVLLFFLLTPLIYAASGVSPSLVRENFEPNFEKKYTIMYFFEGSSKIDFYVSRDLSDYAKITSVKEKNQRFYVTVNLKLPEKLESPGENILRIGARELKNTQGQEETITVAYDVGSRIIVFVPYPGKYANLGLDAENINNEEKLPYRLNVKSMGEEDITVSPSLEITNKEGTKLFEKLSTRTIKSKESYEYDSSLDTRDLEAGDYNLTALVDYGGEKLSEVTSAFRVGELLIKIKNHTRFIEADKVNRFRVDIESFWNEEIDDMYAEVRFPKHPSMDSKSKTIKVDPWESTFIYTFIDTTRIEAEEVDARIILYYKGETTTKDVTIKISEPFDWVLAGVVAIIAFAVVIFIALVIIIIILIRKNKNMNKKK